MRDIAQAVVDKEGQHTHQPMSPAVSNDGRLAALEKSHADMIARLSRHFPALF